jgi:disease resistance protein RPM1
VIDDLWKELPWDAIKLALQDGNRGSKIIITTRNKAIAEHVGGAIYELKPLSSDDSRELFYKRIFVSVDDCPADFSNVTEKILKKCGGVPLAIITTASLLATKPRCSVDWEKVNNFIGSGSENSPHVDKMNTILRLSYNDLPFHLKICLLSMSKYPEDQVIGKDVLVWSWIAEGFITPAGSSLQETAEGYFNELINRSLIQPVHRKDPFYVFGEMEVYACQLHDMVLELIIKLSAEEGFITTLLSHGEEAGASSLHQREIIRRLSLHNSSNTNASINERKLLSKVRSLYVFGHADLVMPSLSGFRALRVLQLEGCSDLDNNHLQDLNKLCLLKFLRLQGLKVTELPESIGKLESLETLDIRGFIKKPRDIRGNWGVIMLPLSFGKLGKLVRLHAESVELPDGVALENMKSLRELVDIRPTLHAMAEIGKLRELKVLELFIKEEPESSSTGNSNELVRTCLQKCPSSLQVLVLRTSISYSLDFMAQIPPGLQTYKSDGYFMAFPRWIDPTLSYLTILSIVLWCVRVQPEHLDKLAGLPSLRFLRIHALLPPDEQEKLVIHSSPSSFPCLTDLRISCPLMFLKFQPGAMRKLHRLCLSFHAGVTNDHFLTNTFDYGFENLPSLQHVVVELVGDEHPEADDAIRTTINDHPNHPSLDFSYA